MWNTAPARTRATRWGCVHGAPATLGGFDQFVGHRDAGDAVIMRKVVEIPELSIRLEVATYHVVSSITSDEPVYFRLAASLGTDASTSAMPGSAWLACAVGGVVVGHLKAGPSRQRRPTPSRPRTSGGHGQTSCGIALCRSAAGHSGQCRAARAVPGGARGQCRAASVRPRAGHTAPGMAIPVRTRFVAIRWTLPLSG